MNAPTAAPPHRHTSLPARFIEGTLTQKEKADFIFGPGRLHSLNSLNQAQKANMASLMSQDKLDTSQLTHLIHGLSEMATDAGTQITLSHQRPDRDALNGNTPSHWEIKEMLLDEILKRSPSHPATRLVSTLRHLEQDWNQLTADMLIEHLEDGTWESIPDTLIGIDMAARYFNAKGSFPPTHTPAQVVRHYADPATRDWHPGANSTNTTLPDLHRPNPNLAGFIESRYILNQDSPAPLTDHDFLRQMVLPYMQQTPHITKAQGGDSGLPELPPGLDGPANDPDTHRVAASASALETTIANSDALLSLNQGHYQDVAATLHRITDHVQAVRELLDQSGQNSHEDTMWGQGPQIWKDIASATKDFADLAPLCQLTVEFTKDLQKRHIASPSEAAATVHYQAAAALRTATEAATALQHDQIQAQDRATLTEQVIAPAQAKAQAGTANPAVQAMLNAFQAREAELALHRGKQDRHFQAQADRALDEMAHAGLPLTLIQALEEDPATTGLLDTAVRCLQHADYLINT